MRACSDAVINIDIFGDRIVYVDSHNDVYANAVIDSDVDVDDNVIGDKHVISDRDSHTDVNAHG